MMKDEKDWNKKDLSVFKTQPFELMVRQIYKHQKFQTKFMLQRINRAQYSECTAKLYCDASKQYLNHGTVSRNVPKRLYTILDECKATHTGILTPPENEKAVIKPSRRTPSPTPQPTTQTTQTTQTQTTPTQYGVKYENTIKLFDSKEFCLGYKECFEVFNKDQKAELIKVNYELVVEENENGTN